MILFGSLRIIINRNIFTSDNVNILRLRQIGLHFADDIVKLIFFVEIFSILVQISLKLDPNGAVDQ